MLRRLFLGIFNPTVYTNTVDHLGVFDRYELYSALITDAKRTKTARLVLSAAWDDPQVTHRQWKELRYDFYRNHG